MTSTLTQPATRRTGAAPLRFEVVFHFSELVERASAWLELLKRSSANEPMLSPQWLLPWFEIYGQTSHRRLCAVFFYENNRLVGLAPLQRRTYRYRPGIPFRRLELLGADVDENDGVCSEYLNLIVEEGYERRVVERLAVALAHREIGPWDEFVIPAMAGDGAMPELLADVFQHAGFQVETQMTATAPYIPLPQTWEEYLAALKKNRADLVKALRDFDKWAGGAAVFHQAATFQEITTGEEILHNLHAKRWRSAGQQGAFASERFTTFHKQVMRFFWEKDALQLHWLTVDDKPLAAMYNFCWNDKVYFYQSGRDLDVPKKIRLGIVMVAHCIRNAIENGQREFDFLAGDVLYKRQLALASRPLVQFRATSSPLREGLRHCAERGINVARRIRDKVRALRQGLVNTL